MKLQLRLPDTRQSLLLTLAFGVVGAAFYFGVIEPADLNLTAAHAVLEEQIVRQRTVLDDLAQKEIILRGLNEKSVRRAAYDAGLMTPLLESTAMRAKALIDPLATGCGLINLEYEAQEPVALPVFGLAAQEQFVREPIRITCRGSYQAAVSLVRCVEKRFELVSLTALSVTATADPELQQITFVFEWPMKKGAVR